MKKSNLIRLIKKITLECLNEDHGLGYSHNATFDMTAKERDPLNDPRLNGKLDETYRFKDVDDVREPLKLPEGFGILTEVYYNNMYIGSIVSTPNGYFIDTVDSPEKVKPVVRSGVNNFKSKNLAAEALHRLWKTQRTE